MVNGFLIVWGIALCAAIVVLLDWLGSRKDRRSKHPPTT